MADPLIERDRIVGDGARQIDDADHFVRAAGRDLFRRQLDQLSGAWSREHGCRRELRRRRGSCSADRGTAPRERREGEREEGNGSKHHTLGGSKRDLNVNLVGQTLREPGRF